MPLEDLTYTCIRSHYPERCETFTFIMNNILVKDMTEGFAVVFLQLECGILLVVRHCDSFYSKAKYVLNRKEEKEINFSTLFYGHRFCFGWLNKERLRHHAILKIFPLDTQVCIAIQDSYNICISSIIQLFGRLLSDI